MSWDHVGVPERKKERAHRPKTMSYTHNVYLVLIGEIMGTCPRGRTGQDNGFGVDGTDGRDHGIMIPVRERARERGLFTGCTKRRVHTVQC